MLDRNKILSSLDSKIALIGDKVCQMERLGKPAVKLEREMMRLIAYKVYMLEPNNGDERDLQLIMENAIKRINKHV